MADVDLQNLARWMDHAGLAGGVIENVRRVGGGTQNIMLRFWRGDREYVLRRGPQHLRPHTNDALRREVRLLQALARTRVPCPRLRAACLDEAVLDGAVFYLMDPVDGFNATVELPALHAQNEDVRKAMGFAAVDALATLHALDHHALGLSDVGRPEGFLARQAPRWLAELEAHKRHAGYRGDELPGVADIAAWLESRVPEVWTPGIVHGDFHLANLMFEPESPKVAAIVDWEMWTIGDPLLDLGWLIVTWPEPGDFTETTAIGKAGGLPHPSQLIERYAAQSQRDLSHLDWYTVLACFKLGIVLEGTFARACAGKADKATGDFLHAAAVKLIERARRQIGRTG